MGKAHADANHKSDAQHNGKDAALRAFAVFSLLCGTHAPHTIQLQHTREQPSRFYTHSSSCSVLLCLSAPAITVVPLTPMLLLTRLHTCTETAKAEIAIIVELKEELAQLATSIGLETDKQKEYLNQTQMSTTHIAAMRADIETLKSERQALEQQMGK